MSIYGKTKGTELEEMIDKLAEGEAKAAGMYFALSHIAQEQGNEKIAKVLAKIGADEARHSGMYAMLNGKVPEDIYSMMPMLEKEEKGAEPMLLGLAKKAADLGLEDVAKAIEEAAKDEIFHGNAVLNIKKA